MSTSWYAKLDAGFHANRKARKAGRLGREFFVFVLCQNAQRGMTGSIPADDLEPWFVAEQLQMTEDEAGEAIRRAVDAGLINVTKDRVTIRGWDEEWGKRPLSAAERQQRHRDRNANRSTNNDVHVTRHGATATSNGSTKRNDDNVTNNGRRDASRRKEGIKEGRKEGRDRERRATARLLPSDFRPAEETTRIAGERRLNLEHELAQFRDHCASTGKKSQDWDAELRKWLRASEGRGAPATGGTTTLVGPSVEYQRSVINPHHFTEVVDGEPRRLVERADDGSWREVPR